MGMGSRNKFLDSIQRLKNVNALDKRELSTGTMSNTNKNTLSKAVEQLKQVPQMEQLTSAQADAMDKAIKLFERKKVIKPAKEPTIEQMGEL